MSFNKWGAILDSNVLAGLVLTTSLLMITRLPLPGLPRFTLREQGYNLVKVLVLLGGVFFIVVNPPENAFPALAALVVVGFTIGIVRALRKTVDSDPTDDSLDDAEPHHEPLPITRGGRR
jgi:phosphatidylserine synthase